MKKKNHIKVRFSTILLCIPVILLCAAPRGWAVIYDDGGTHPVEEDIDWLHVVGADTTVNLYADVSQYVYAFPGSVLNIYSGNVALYIMVWQDAKVTVYGFNFAAKEGGVIDPSANQFTTTVAGIGSNLASGVLTGTYGGNGGLIELRFVSEVPIIVFLKPPVTTEVAIDIKPGVNHNNINLRSKGVVPVAVLSTWDFNAGTIDPGTVLFAGAGPERSTLEDVDEDGDMDMLFHFKTQYLNLEEDSTEATLTGETFDGVGIELTDTVRIVQSKKE